MVMRIVLYTLLLSKTFTLGLLPPAININPKAITATPINIHLRFVFSKSVPIPTGAFTAFADFEEVAGLVVLVVAMKNS